MPIGTVVSWSSGKDSAWLLHVLRRDPEVEIAGLLTTVNVDHNRVAMHAVRRDVLERQAQVLGLDLEVVGIPQFCTNEQYELAMQSAMHRLKARDIRQIAFGDLLLEDVKTYRMEQMQRMGMQSVFPLWQANTRALAEQMIDAGLKAILTCVDPKVLPAAFAGRTFDRELLKDLPETADPCGENGEFHTFVHDGPMFRRAIPVVRGDVVERDGFVFADLLLAD